MSKKQVLYPFHRLKFKLLFRLGGQAIAIVHCGADLLPRTCYLPTVWPLRVSVADATGRIKEGAPISYNIAGPLCFSGDLIARERPLPSISVGDWLIVHDVGAYTLGMWSIYNSRQV